MKFKRLFQQHSKMLHWPQSFFFCPAYADIYLMCAKREAEDSSKARSYVPMRTFKESEKSQKTVKSMIETKGGDKGKEQGGKKNKNTKKEGECCWLVVLK